MPFIIFFYIAVSIYYMLCVCFCLLFTQVHLQGSFFYRCYAQLTFVLMYSIYAQHYLSIYTHIFPNAYLIVFQCGPIYFALYPYNIKLLILHIFTDWKWKWIY